MVHRSTIFEEWSPEGMKNWKQMQSSKTNKKLKEVDNNGQNNE